MTNWDSVSYIETTVIVEGVVDREFSAPGAAYDEALAEARTIIEDLEDEGVELAAVYLLEHFHPEDIDCECVQYLLDDRPAASIGMGY